MRHLLTLVSLLLVGSVWADDFNFNSPRAKAAIEKYQYDKEDLLRDLEAALEHERTKGSLEEAIKIRDAIATLKQQPDAPVANAQIPADAVEWNGHYYRVSNKRLPHDQAKQFCENAGGHLVRIESAAEQEFVAGLTRDTASPLIWIDGSDGNREGAWFFSNGVPMKFFFWAVNTPDNHQQIEHHIVLNRPPLYEGRWGDVAADGHKASFICEWDGPAGSTQRAKKIPADAVNWNGHHYWVSNEETTWHEANVKCEKMGGHLARIENQAKQEFISRFLKEKIKTPVDQQTKGERDHWVDGIRSPDGVWRFGNGAKMNYLNWFPNTGEQIEDPNPHHRWIFLGWPARDHYWANVSADIRVGFICEWDGMTPETPTKPERTKPKPEEPIKKLSPKHAKRVLDDANLWEGKPGVWFLKRANNFSGRTYERLSQSNRIRSALASVNGRLPTPDEMNNPPSRR